MGKQEEGIQSIVEKIGRLEILARRSFGGSGPGERIGGASGGRSEFAGYAPYHPGADFRDIDWNLAARFDALHVRQYRREEGIPVRIYIDASASMSSPDPGKFRFAREVAYGLGIVALTRLHPVRLWRVWGEGVDGGQQFQSPAAQGLMRKCLEEMTSSGPLDLPEAIDVSRKVDPEPSLSIWISDGYGGTVVPERLIATEEAVSMPTVG